MSNENEIDKDLFYEFLAESSDSLLSLDELFVQIEKNPDDLGLVDKIFRPVHSIKGNSSFFGLLNVKKFSHSFESLLQEIRSGKKKITEEIIDVFLEGGDCLRGMIDRASPDEDSSVLSEKEAEVLDKIEFFINGESEDDSVKILEAKKKLVAIIGMSESEPVRNLLHEVDELLEEITQSLSVVATNVGGGIYHLGDAVVTEQVEVLAEFIKNVEENSKDKDKSEAFIDAINSLEHVATEVNSSSIIEHLNSMKNDYLTISDAGIGFDEIMSSLIEERFESAMKSIKVIQSEGEGTDELCVGTDKGADKTKDSKEAAQDASENIIPAETNTTPQKTQTKSKDVSGKTIRVEEEKVDNFMSFVGELIIASEVFAYLQQKLEAYPNVRSISQEFKNANISFNELSNNLQKSLMSVRRLPLKSVMQRLPRIIRELASDTGKKVNLEIIGEETSVDKSLIEGLEDPLVHMVRNSVDHGIEVSEERVTAGKPPEGRVTITATSTEEVFTISIKDDGAGIDLEKVKQKAVDKGVISEERALTMSDSEAGRLIFGAGVSTAKKVTEISGRGVGMDVVRTNIEKLGGEILVETELGYGSEFIITLPMTVTLMVVDGLVAKVGDGHFILPINDVREAVRPTKDATILVTGKGEMLNVRGELYKLIKLYEILGIDAKCKDSGSATIILVEFQDEVCGVMVDDVVGQQSVVLKDLGKKFELLEVIKGGSVMGDGSIGLVLDIEGIFEQAKL